jgi:hypothetical protein
MMMVITNALVAIIATHAVSHLHAAPHRQNNADNCYILVATHFVCE